MKVLNFGSINIDHVYSVDHIVQPGETISSSGIELFAGGKGLNQSVALAKAGVPVYHAGLIGNDSAEVLHDTFEKNGINTELLGRIPGETGHTIIQVDKNGMNSIVLYGGANRKITKQYVDSVLDHFDSGDVILLQNEINLIDYIIGESFRKHLTIALNPSPFDDNLQSCDLGKVSCFLLNEVEGNQLTGESEPDKILRSMRRKFPNAKIVLTLGSQGSIYQDSGNCFRQKAYKVNAVDTTAAGDTFTGYFIAGLVKKMQIPQTMDLAAKAAAVAVTRKGASDSIPTIREVMDSSL